jgi:hypothetical protein
VNEVRVRPPERLGYREACEKLCPELRAALLDAATRGGYDDADPIWGLFVAQGHLLEWLQAQLPARIDAVLEARLAKAAAVNAAAREKQTKDIGQKFEALHHKNPGRGALWCALSAALTCALTWMLVKGLDETAMSKERASLAQHRAEYYKMGYQAAEEAAAAGSGLGRIQPLPALNPEPGDLPPPPAPSPEWRPAPRAAPVAGSRANTR